MTAPYDFGVDLHGYDGTCVYILIYHNCFIYFHTDTCNSSERVLDSSLVFGTLCFLRKITKNVLLGLLTFYVVGTHQNFIIQGSLLS
jgi:hypothetical protein